MAHALPDWLKLDMRRIWTDRPLAGLRRQRRYAPA